MRKAIEEIAAQVAARLRPTTPMRVVPSAPARRRTSSTACARRSRRAARDYEIESVGEVGAVIGTYTGPEVVGVAYHPREASMTGAADRIARLRGLGRAGHGACASSTTRAPRRSAKLGVATVEDLLRHYPFRYLDLTATATLDASPRRRGRHRGRARCTRSR